MQKTPFQLFVDEFGTQEKAAAALDRSRVTVNLIYNGKRDVPLALARQIERMSNGRFRAVDLLGLRAA